MGLCAEKKNAFAFCEMITVIYNRARELNDYAGVIKDFFRIRMLIYGKIWARGFCNKIINSLPLPLALVTRLCRMTNMFRNEKWAPFPQPGRFQIF